MLLAEPVVREFLLLFHLVLYLMLVVVAEVRDIQVEEEQLLVVLQQLVVELEVKYPLQTEQLVQLTLVVAAVEAAELEVVELVEGEMVVPE